MSEKLDKIKPLMSGGCDLNKYSHIERANRKVKEIDNVVTVLAKLSAIRQQTMKMLDINNRQS